MQLVRLFVVCCVLALLGALILPAGPADAAAISIRVTTDRDVVDARDGVTSLREAVSRANQNVGKDFITLVGNTRYALTRCGALGEDANATGDLDLNDIRGVNVTGGPGTEIRQTCAGQRVLDARARSLYVIGIAVTGGNARTDANHANDDGRGGGILASGEVVLIITSVSGNMSVLGGGGVDAGTFTAMESSITGNSGRQTGGVHTRGGALLQRSTVSANSGHMTGGLYAEDGNIVLQQSTVSANTGNVGGVNGEGVTVEASTVTGNTGMSAGGIRSPHVRLSFATVVDNDGLFAAQIGVGEEGLEAFGSVVGPPVLPGRSCDVENAWNNIRYNFDSDGTCGFDDPTNIANGGDPGLGPLAANGGLTRTHVPQAGSPLLDRIPVGAPECRGSDQRGVARPQGAGCDIGAVERN